MILALSGAVLVLFSSCLTSLHNLTTSKDVVRYDGITGNWQFNGMGVQIEKVPSSHFFKKLFDSKSEKNSFKSSYESLEDSLLYSNAYSVEFTKDSYHYVMICCLTRINGDLYADLEPVTVIPAGEPSAADMAELFKTGNYITTHSIAKLAVNKNRVEFRMISGDFVQQQLEKGTAALAFEHDDLFGSTLITAPTSQLRSFLEKYGNDRRLYSDRNTITLTKQ